MSTAPGGQRLPAAASGRTSAIAAALVLVAAVAAAPRPAAAYGACCMGDNVCGDVGYATCPPSGYWWGEGTSCDDINANGQPGGPCDLGACCQRRSPSHPQGACDYTNKAECHSLCGKWMGGLSSCSQFGGTTCADMFARSPLPGDCDENGHVETAELVAGVLLALCAGVTGPCCASGPGYRNCFLVNLGACRAADVDGSGQVTIDEVVQAVDAAIHCF
jgi:hypothetical protein